MANESGREREQTGQLFHDSNRPSSLETKVCSHPAVSGSVNPGLRTQGCGPPHRDGGSLRAKVVINLVWWPAGHLRKHQALTHRR
ncbi:hypothetical protein [Streptomyces sp. NEAU-YJ-81]|uniref:hypothetical protein n=1 Tax=Streptomyces sp. NEAU-YJ-81 TaxID=2820288 RepID=UPI001ABCCACE|nr:hypothetical protein [Streptomyces sp. NEAU-YJ-81]MBO3675647.1 hypothetical protein [Streptomyces sp. NEAU-YJ-81]